jgi:hypothetical protein
MFPLPVDRSTTPSTGRLTSASIAPLASSTVMSPRMRSRLTSPSKFSTETALSTADIDTSPVTLLTVTAKPSGTVIS